MRVQHPGPPKGPRAERDKANVEAKVMEVDDVVLPDRSQDEVWAERDRKSTPHPARDPQDPDAIQDFIRGEPHVSIRSEVAGQGEDGHVVARLALRHCQIADIALRAADERRVAPADMEDS
jgi:hypothetical protein